MLIVDTGRGAGSGLPEGAPWARVRRVEAPLLREEGVTVRALAPRDAGALAGLAADPDVQRWTPSAPDPHATDAAAAVERARHGWATGRHLELAVERDGVWAGTVALHPDGRAGADLAYALLPAARGRRTASGAVRLLLTWAFVELGLQVVHWRCPVGAWPARRVAWACGFAVEGTVRDLLADGGDRRDAWVASLRWDDPLRPRGRWLAPVALAGDGVRLGPHVPGDVERVAQACAAASTQQWLPGLPAPYTVLDAAAYVSGREEQQATGAGVYWAVRGDGGGDLLAEVALFRLGAGAASGEGTASGEVGYWCHPAARGRGVTTAAVRLVARHALSPQGRGGLGLERLVLKVARGNTASERVAQKAGFTLVGADRRAERLRDGTRVDFLRHDLLAEELAGELAGPA